MGKLHAYSFIPVYAVVVAFVFSVYVLTIAPSITWSDDSADSAELALAAAEPGIAHPPGYPAYVLIAHLWLKSGIRTDIAASLNFLSAFSMLITSINVMFIIRSFDGENAGLIERVGSGVLATAFALSPLIWLNAITTEVYASGLLVLSAIMLIMLHFLKSPGMKTIFFAGLLIGAGYGVAPFIGMVYLPLVTLIALSGRIPGRRYKLRTVLTLSIGCVAGLSIFLYLPLRAASNPLMNWGRPSNFSQFVWVITASQYHHLSGAGDSYAIYHRALAALKILFENSGFLGSVLSIAGIYRYLKDTFEFGFLVISIIVLSVVMFIWYPVKGSDAYLLPALSGIFITAGIGFVYILSRLKQRTWKLIPVIIAGIIVLSRAYNSYPGVDKSQDIEALQFAVEVINQATEDAIIITGHDETTFSLWYGQRILNRYDIIVIDSRLLYYDWYKENLLLQYPALNADYLRHGGLSGLNNVIYSIIWTDGANQFALIREQ